MVQWRKLHITMLVSHILAFLAFQSIDKYAVLSLTWRKLFCGNEGIQYKGKIVPLSGIKPAVVQRQDLTPARSLTYRIYYWIQFNTQSSPIKTNKNSVLGTFTFYHFIPIINLYHYKSSNHQNGLHIMDHRFFDSHSIT